jgi:hypothetical protein
MLGLCAHQVVYLFGNPFKRLQRVGNTHKAAVNIFLKVGFRILLKRLMTNQV